MSIGYQNATILERSGMAKTRAQGRPEPREPDRVDPEDQKTLLSLKGRKEWLDWLDEFAVFLGVPRTTAVDAALREHAKKEGFGKPMPKRMSR